MARLSNGNHATRITIRQLLVPGMTPELAAERIATLRLMCPDVSIPSAGALESALLEGRRRQPRADRIEDAVADFERDSVGKAHAMLFGERHRTTDLYKLITQQV